MLVDEITEDCVIDSAQLDRHGQLYTGAYNCTSQGFQRRPSRRWAVEPILMLGPGPFDL